MLHNDFRADFDFEDNEIALLKTAQKVKASHVYGDKSVAAHEFRPKGSCTKVRFRSRKDALQALRTIKHFRALYEELGYTHPKVERRAYRCAESRHGSHLTSTPWNAPKQPAQVIPFKRPVEIEFPLVVAHVA